MATPVSRVGHWGQEPEPWVRGEGGRVGQSPALGAMLTPGGPGGTGLNGRSRRSRDLGERRDTPPIEQTQRETRPPACHSPSLVLQPSLPLPVHSEGPASALCSQNWNRPFFPPSTRTYSSSHTRRTHAGRVWWAAGTTPLHPRVNPTFPNIRASGPELRLPPQSTACQALAPTR